MHREQAAKGKEGEGGEQGEKVGSSLFVGKNSRPPILTPSTCCSTSSKNERSCLRPGPVLHSRTPELDRVRLGPPDGQANLRLPSSQPHAVQVLQKKLVRGKPLFGIKFNPSLALPFKQQLPPPTTQLLK